MESKSLNIILDEINKRKDFYIEQETNLKAKSLDLIQKEFKENIKELSVEILSKKDTTTINKLIKIIEFEKSDFDFSTEKGYEDLFQKIKEFIELNERRIESSRTSINECEYYESFFKGMNKKHDLFTDIKGLRLFIDSLGLNNSEKISVEKYLAEYNTKAKVLDPEITETVTYIYNEINNYQDVKDAIRDYIYKNKLKVDLNFIKSYAYEISKEIGKSPELVENVFIGMILGKEYKKYIDDGEVDHLTRMHRVLNEFTFDDMRMVISEANRIFNLEMMGLQNNKSYEFGEIVVTDASTLEEFEEKKNEKKAMIAYLLKNKVEDYEKNNNFELKDKYKELIIGLIDEYYKTNALTFSEGKTR